MANKKKKYSFIDRMSYYEKKANSGKTASAFQSILAACGHAGLGCVPVYQPGIGPGVGQESFRSQWQSFEQLHGWH